MAKATSIIAIRIATVLGKLGAVIYFSHLLTKADYGDYVTFWLLLSVLTLFGSLGIGMVIFSLQKGQIEAILKSFKPRSYVLYFSFLVLLGIVMAVAMNLNGISVTSGWMVLALVWLLVTSVLAFILENILLLFSNTSFQLIVSLVYALLFLLAHYLSINDQSLRLSYLITTLAILSTVKLFALILGLRKQLRLTSPIIIPLPVSGLKSLWIQLGIYDMLQMGFRYADKLIIAFIASKQASAQYYNGRIEIPFIATILSSVQSAALIAMAQHPKLAVRITLSGSSILTTVAFAAMSLAYFFSQELITLIFSTKYIDSIPIFIASLWLLPAQYCTTAITVLQQRQRGDLINKGAITDVLVTLLLIMPLYSSFGAIGMVIAFVIGTYAQALFYLFTAAKLLKVNWYELLPIKVYIIKAGVFGLVGYLLYLGLNHLDAVPLVRLLSGCVGIGSVFLIFYLNERKKHSFDPDLV